MLSGNNKSAAYAQKIANELNARNGRLFLVDSDKYCAASALMPLISNSSSSICIAADAEVAQDFASLFVDAKLEHTVVTSFNDFVKLLKELDVNTDRLNENACQSIASKFNQRFANLIVAATDCDGNALLNRKLCQYSSWWGIYAGADGKADYCLSDFLAACRYEFAIADDIYGLLNLEEQDIKGKLQNINPLKNEGISFGGKWYFTSTEYSFKKLSNIFSAASKRVLLSDVIVYDRFVEMFVATKLLSDEGALYDMEKAVKSADSSYEEYIESVFTEVKLAVGDEGIINLLIGKLRDSKQIVPNNSQELSNYLDAAMRFVSGKEFFLRMMTAYAAENNGRLGRLENEIDRLSNSDSLMTACLKRVFFSSDVKEAYEEFLTSDRLCLLNDGEVAKLLQVFNKYGVYQGYSYDCDDVDTIRIMRDDSGYEAFIEQHASFVTNNAEGAPVVDETEYSVIHEGSDLLYECATLAQICTDPNAPRKAQFPMLVVTDEDPSETRRILEELIPDLTVSCKFEHVSNFEKTKTVVIADFERLEKSARRISAKTVIFFGTPANPQRVLTLLNKCSASGARSIIITRYGDLSARLSAKWNHVLERNTNRALPLGMGVIQIKDNKFDDYDDVVMCLEEVYEGLKFLAEGTKDNSAELTDKFKKLLLDYAVDTSLNLSVTNKDFNYLYQIAEAYGNVFKNSVSIGRSGESVSAYPYAARVKESVQSDTVMLFNVCAKMLRRTCDGKQKDCRDCTEYTRFYKNSFDTFERCVKHFFSETAKYARRRDEERQKEIDVDKIHSTAGAGDTTLLTLSSVEEVRSSVLEALDELIVQASRYKGVFATDYKPVMEIKHATTALYSRALDRYFGRLIAIFENLSDKVVVRYENQIL